MSRKDIGAEKHCMPKALHVSTSSEPGAVHADRVTTGVATELFVLIHALGPAPLFSHRPTNAHVSVMAKGILNTNAAVQTVVVLFMIGTKTVQCCALSHA
ncbi:unnamed protein product [Prorocentrum cordatum]|uniref:Uncharacterized protein n=1 Tax=Prorocentrum cordatum TaxID=2364126 RepID=A0ABN9RDD8_9DINO|nr:unnamed protein product [Polarella glacialis]